MVSTRFDTKSICPRRIRLCVPSDCQYPSDFDCDGGDLASTDDGDKDFRRAQFPRSHNANTQLLGRLGAPDGLVPMCNLTRPDFPLEKTSHFKRSHWSVGAVAKERAKESPYILATGKYSRDFSAGLNWE